MTISDMLLECANICESFARAVCLEKDGDKESLRTQLHSIALQLDELNDEVLLLWSNHERDA